MSNIFIVGATGPGAIALTKALLAAGHHVVVGSERDQAGAKMLVEPSDRVRHPSAQTPGFIDALLVWCAQRRIDLVVPTAWDAGLAMVTARDRFTATGVQVMAPSLRTFVLCMDRWLQHLQLRGLECAVGAWLLDRELDLSQVDFPVIAEPRERLGRRPAIAAEGPADIIHLPRSGAYVVRECVRGTLVDVDVLADHQGHVVCAVPRTQVAHHDGVARVERTLLDTAAVRAATHVSQRIGLTSFGTIRLVRDTFGRMNVVDVHPFATSGLTLTAGAGVNIPALAAGFLEGKPVPTDVPFREVFHARYYHDRFVPVAGSDLEVDPFVLAA